TKKEMASKHPKPEPIFPEALLTGELPSNLHPVFYNALDGAREEMCSENERGVRYFTTRRWSLAQDGYWAQGSLFLSMQRCGSGGAPTCNRVCRPQGTGMPARQSRYRHRQVSRSPT